MKYVYGYAVQRKKKDIQLKNVDVDVTMTTAQHSKFIFNENDEMWTVTVHSFENSRFKLWKIL